MKKAALVCANIEVSCTETGKSIETAVYNNHIGYQFNYAPDEIKGKQIDEVIDAFEKGGGALTSKIIEPHFNINNTLTFKLTGIKYKDGTLLTLKEYIERDKPKEIK